MRNFIFIAIFILLLSACSKNEPAIIKQETSSNHHSGKPELIEETTEEETKGYIDFPVADELVRINLEMVPILKEYLAVIYDADEAIDQMKLERVHTQGESIYLLEFSCVSELCSYLLLNPSSDKQSYLLADMAKYTDMRASPDNNKLSFRFDRQKASPLPLTNIVVIDIKSWTTLSLNNEMNDDNILHYTWPILTFEWIDNESISIDIPAVTEPTEELIYKWQEEGERNITNNTLRIITK
ncbi:hypothetical protein [Virgibacillus ainsalahensis]